MIIVAFRNSKRAELISTPRGLAAELSDGAMPQQQGCCFYWHSRAVRDNSPTQSLFKHGSYFVVGWRISSAASRPTTLTLEEGQDGGTWARESGKLGACIDKYCRRAGRPRFAPIMFVLQEVRGH